MTARASGAQGGVTEPAFAAMLARRNATMPRNNRIALLGPSHAANHFSQATDGTGLTPLPSGSSQGPVNWANFLSGGRALLETADSFGYNGDWTDAATFNSVAYPGIASRVDAALASGAGHIVLVAPSANDRNGWGSAQSIAAIEAIIARIRAKGVLLTILLDYPHGSATATSYILSNTAGSPQLDHYMAVNRSLAGWHGRGGVRVIDTAALLADVIATNGQAIAGVLADGLHLNQLGAYLIGLALARDWRRLYPAPVALPFGNGERINQAGINAAPLQSVNPFMAGSTAISGATGASGQRADNWTVPNLSNGVTGAYSKVATTGFAAIPYVEQDGRPSKDWQQIVLSGTASGNGEVQLLRQSVTCAPGDIVRAVAEVEVDPGVTGISGFEIYVWEAAGGVAVRQLAIPAACETTVWPNYAIAGVMRTPRWTNASGQYWLTLACRPITGQAISGTIRMRGLAAGKGLV